MQLQPQLSTTFHVVLELVLVLVVSVRWAARIRNGEATHTGVIPFLKHFQTAVKSCSQGGVRGGAATAFYPIWHLEVESLLVVKNNRGIDENRVRHLDYGVMSNRLMYRRLVRSENITLFSPHDVPDMYEAFFTDQSCLKSCTINTKPMIQFARSQYLPLSCSHL